MDTLLGGRVRYSQPERGFRSGIEPVLLAAAVPAKAGDRVLEGGAGAGAGLLCLAARVRGLVAIGIELEGRLAAFADANARANQSAIHFVAADALTLPLRAVFDHAFANPPYYDVSGTASPEASRNGAKRGAAGTLALWARSLGSALRPSGTLTFVLPPARLAEAIDGCAAAECGGVRLFPLWPRAGVAAKLLLLRAVRNSRAPLMVLPGLVLHDADGGFTALAEAYLRGAAPLEL